MYTKFFNAPTLPYFAVLKHKLCWKDCMFQGIRTWVAGVEGNYADHWTIATTALLYPKYRDN